MALTDSKLDDFYAKSSTQNEQSVTDDEVAFIRGLIAGEGHFGIKLENDESMKFNVETRPAFSMGMAEQSNILPLLQSKTGLGNVYDVEKRGNRSDQEGWQIRKQSELDELIQLLERDTSNWKEFFLGLISAEGSFQIRLGNDESMKFNVSTRPAFSIGMAEQSNILPLLQSKTGLGNVRDREYQEEKRADQEDWQIRKQSELDELATMIESQDDSLFWETDKGMVFEEWQRARELKDEIGTSDPDAVKEIIDIAKSLNGTEQGRPAEEWKAIIDDASETA